MSKPEVFTLLRTGSIHFALTIQEEILTYFCVNDIDEYKPFGKRDKEFRHI